MPQPRNLKTRTPRESERGQASVMVGVLMLTFLFFFCFVANVGMLVNAKINLQNAADLAAYSGAAVQARHLNTISFLNYEMRRQYKKFLFRYYVIGNMSQASFPKGVSAAAGTTHYNFKPTAPSNPKGDPYEVPVVCIIYNANDNYCQLAKLPKIVSPPKGQFDAINTELIRQLENFEQIRQNNCKAIAAANLFTLEFWLKNTDPDFTHFTSGAGLSDNAKRAFEVIKGLSSGLGLIPRETLLRMRIETVAKYVNRTAKTGITLETAGNLKTGPDPSEDERTISAFMSAYLSLGHNTFPAEDITMDEILPTQLLKLNPIEVKFDAYAMDFVLNPPNPPPGVSANCEPQMTYQGIQQPLKLGFKKDQDIHTYYSVRLRAKAKTLFSPWGDVELKAYAAAQPFGSRIGPYGVEEKDFVRMGAVPGIPTNNTFGILNKIPNLPIAKGETTDAGRGWDSREALGTLLATAFPQILSAGTGGGSVVTLDSTDLERAYHLAMAPNPYESSLYNIPNDLDGASHHFRKAFDARKRMVLWAPITPPSQAGDADTEIRTVINELFPDNGSDPDVAGKKSAFLNGISEYIAKIKTGSGENDETYNTVQITDPFYPRPEFGGAPGTSSTELLGLPAWAMIKEPKDALTSWNKPNDASTHSSTLGRLGYSVKFVSFEGLRNNRTPSTGEGAVWTNGLSSLDEEAEIDIDAIKH